MTREEAIERIKQNKAAAEFYAGQSRITAEIENALKDSEAFDMAIEALHREEAEEKGWCHRIIPSNVEVVVRCKDCKHRSYEGWCDVYIQPRMDTDFCNHGERQCNYFERKGGDDK